MLRHLAKVLGRESRFDALMETASYLDEHGVAFEQGDPPLAASEAPHGVALANLAHELRSVPQMIRWL